MRLSAALLEKYMKNILFVTWPSTIIVPVSDMRLGGKKSKTGIPKQRYLFLL